MSQTLSPGCKVGFVADRGDGAFRRVTGIFVALGGDPAVVAVPLNALGSAEVPLESYEVTEAEGKSKVAFDLVSIPAGEVTVEVHIWTKACGFETRPATRKLLALHYGPEVKVVNIIQERMLTASSGGEVKRLKQKVQSLEKSTASSQQSWQLIASQHPEVLSNLRCPPLASHLPSRMAVRLNAEGEVEEDNRFGFAGRLIARESCLQKVGVSRGCSLCSERCSRDEILFCSLT